MAFALIVMGILVFGNVVLRYAFNSGITWSEELSRFFFIWLTFLGAVGALRDHQHLGMDALVKRLPHKLKKATFIFRSAIVIFLLYLVLEGTYKLVLLNLDSPSPALGLDLAWVYVIGIFASAAMIIFVLSHIYRLLRLNADIEKFMEIKGSEEEINIPSTDHSTK